MRKRAAPRLLLPTSLVESSSSSSEGDNGGGSRRFVSILKQLEEEESELRIDEDATRMSHPTPHGGVIVSDKRRGSIHALVSVVTQAQARITGRSLRTLMVIESIPNRLLRLERSVKVLSGLVGLVSVLTRVVVMRMMNRNPFFGNQKKEDK